MKAVLKLNTKCRPDLKILNGQIYLSHISKTKYNLFQLRLFPVNASDNCKRNMSYS